MSRSALLRGVAAVALFSHAHPSAAQQADAGRPILLPEIIIAQAPITQTTAGPVDGYRAVTAISATKTSTPIEQIPQSIQVVPRSVIDDQVNLTVAEAVHNVSNVQAPNALGIENVGIGTGATIRGFPAEEWLDGLTVPYDAGYRDATVNVERIEVLKGPNAIVYGGGSGAPIGGAINVISKLPTDKASVEVGSTFGSYGYSRPYFDVNQPLTTNNNVLFRVTGEFVDAHSYVDVLHSDKYSFNPTLTLTNHSDTSLTIQGRTSRATQQEYPGLPATGTVAGTFRLNPTEFLQSPDIPRSYSDVHSITVTLDHQFNPVLSTDVKARWSQSTLSQRSQLLINSDLTGATPLIAPSTWGTANSNIQQRQDEITLNPTLQAKIDRGPTKNIVLLGADYSRINDSGFMYTDFLPSLVDLSNPYPSFPGYADPQKTSAGFVPFFDFKSSYTTTGAYAQLQSTLFDRVHLMTGVRAASVDIDYYEKTLTQGSVTDETKVLPRAGLMIDIVEDFSIYGSYSQGLRGVPFVSASLTPKPESSEQTEAGIKFNFFKQFSGTAAYFDIDRDNIAVPTGVGTAVYSHQKSHGVETDLIWQPTPSFQAIASYGHADVVFADALSGVPAGTKVPAVPADSGRLWANYKFPQPMLRGWSIGAGVYLASAQYVDNANLYKTPGYHTFDGKLAYTNGRFTASFDAKNLTGEKYYIPYVWLGGQVAPGDYRAFYGTVSYKY